MINTNRRKADGCSYVQPIKFFTHLKLSQCVMAATILSGLAMSVPSVQADTLSDDMVFGLSRLPCNNISYPVLESYQVYALGVKTGQNLVNGAEQRLTATDSIKQIHSVTNSFSATTTIEYKVEFSDPILKSVKSTLGFSLSMSAGTAITNGTETSFSLANQLIIIARVDGLTATPSAFRLQAWGSHYMCPVGGTPVRQGNFGDVDINVVAGEGWIIRKQGTFASPSDYSSGSAGD